MSQQACSAQGAARGRPAGDASTVVRLRLGYFLPVNLAARVGHVGVWADVNAVLQADMLAMKARLPLRTQECGCAA